MFFKHLIVIDICSIEKRIESWAFDKKEEDTRFLETRGEKREKGQSKSQNKKRPRTGRRGSQVGY